MLSWFTVSLGGWGGRGGVALGSLFTVSDDDSCFVTPLR